MQDAVYKPHQINDEVFLILYVQEQPYRPILLRCIVQGVDRQKKTTFYYTQPVEVFTEVPEVSTIRCINRKTEKYKDISVFNDSDNLSWVQFFSNKFDEWLIDSPQSAVFDTKREAIEMINKLNMSIITRLNNEVIAILNQNTTLNGI